MPDTAPRAWSLGRPRPSCATSLAKLGLGTLKQTATPRMCTDRSADPREIAWPIDPAADVKRRSLDWRHREEDGSEIRRENGNALVGYRSRRCRATSQRSPSSDPTALLGRGDPATELKIAGPEHQFSPMRSFEAQSWTKPRRRRCSTKAESRAEANDYEAEMCSKYGNFPVVRNGICVKCDTCGGTSGCS
jgi:hypothetical protein